MAKAAKSPKLKAAFEKHLGETEGQVERLEQVFASIDETPKGKTCDAIWESSKRARRSWTSTRARRPRRRSSRRRTGSRARDFPIGTLKTWANQLGYKRQAARCDTE